MLFKKVLTSYLPHCLLILFWILKQNTSRNKTSFKNSATLNFKVLNSKGCWTKSRIFALSTCVIRSRTSKKHILTNHTHIFPRFILSFLVNRKLFKCARLRKISSRSPCYPHYLSFVNSRSLFYITLNPFRPCVHCNAHQI